jgi:hypothetical protein
MDQSDEWLEEQVFLNRALMQKGDQGFEGQAFLDVLKGRLVALYADVGEQVQVLHEVTPMVFISIVPALVLHQVTLLK